MSSKGNETLQLCNIHNRSVTEGVINQSSRAAAYSSVCWRLPVFGFASEVQVAPSSSHEPMESFVGVCGLHAVAVGAGSSCAFMSSGAFTGAKRGNRSKTCSHRRRVALFVLSLSLYWPPGLS